MEVLPGGGGYLRTGHQPDSEEQPRFLVTGASGQIGAELIPMLRERWVAYSLYCLSQLSQSSTASSVTKRILSHTLIVNSARKPIIRGWIIWA